MRSWGLYGGKDALANRFSVVAKTARKNHQPAKHLVMSRSTGEGFLVEVGGGGGFWNPLERDPPGARRRLLRLCFARSGAAGLWCGDQPAGTSFRAGCRGDERIAGQQNGEGLKAPNPEVRHSRVLLAGI